MENLEHLIENLKKVPIFSGLRPEQLEMLAKLATVGPTKRAK